MYWYSMVVNIFRQYTPRGVASFLTSWGPGWLSFPHIKKLHALTDLTATLWAQWRIIYYKQYNNQTKNLSARAYRAMGWLRSWYNGRYIIFSLEWNQLQVYMGSKIRVNETVTLTMKYSVDKKSFMYLGYQSFLFSYWFPVVLDKAPSVRGEARTAMRKAHSTVYFILDLLRKEFSGHLYGVTVWTV